MSDRRESLRRAFVLFHLTLGGVVFLQSVLTTAQASPFFRTDGSTHLLPLFLGGIEAVFALVFLVPRGVRFGAVGLIAVFAFAGVLHGLAGEFPGSLLIDAAGVAFVAKHGAAYQRQPDNDRLTAAA